MVTLAGGIVLAFMSGRIVVDSASYSVPDLPVIFLPIILLILYEFLVIPWLARNHVLYALIRAPILPALIAVFVLPDSIEIHIIILLLGSTGLFSEAKLLLDIAAKKRQVLYSMAAIFRGLAGFMALVYSIALIQPMLENSIITITQLILALLPFIILGSYMGITLYMLTITRDPLKLAAMLAPTTLAAIILTIITYIYTQPALSNPDLALNVYGNMTRTISLLAPMTIVAQLVLEKKT